MEKYQKLIWFGCIGGTATVAYAVLAFVMTAELGWLPVVGSAIAYTVCGFFSFFGHKMLTFKSSAPVATEAHRFLITTLVGYGLAVLIPFLVTQKMEFDNRISIALVCILSPLLNYVFLNYFVFKKRISTT